MGELTSKLRARISRRHSGIPPLPSTARQDGSDSNHGTRSSRTNGTGPDSAKAAADVPEQQDAASHTRPASTRSSRLSGAQWAAKLRQGAKHLSGAMGGADVSDATTKHGYNNSRAASLPPPDVNEDDQRSRTACSAQSAASNGDGLAVAGNDQRPLPLPTVNEPEHTTDAAAAAAAAATAAPSPQSLPTTTLPPPLVGPALDDEAKPRGSTDAVHKVRLSDPPASSDPPGLAPTKHRDSADLTSTPTSQLRPSASLSRPAAPPRRQSLLPSRQTTLIRTLLSAGQADDLDLAAAEQLLPISANMVTRKLWVKRPGASATLVIISEEDLVDDVRELILRKYGNSLGRQYDAPDLTLRIVPREGQRQERVLGPDEPMTRTLDAYFPGGQTVDEALLIDVPHRRTPRASPRHGPPHAQHMTSVNYDDIRPLEAVTDYFGPGAIAHIPVTIAGAPNGATHAISVLNTGQVPQIPSPGGTSRSRQYRERSDRPRLGRQHTSSPTMLNVVGAGGHTATIAVATNHEQTNPGQPVPPAPPLPTPPSQEVAAAVPIARTATPPPARAASPRPPPASRPKKKKTADAPALPSGMLNGGVPPINVLIVEDNIINLRLLEAFVKRLKVRWQTAMNGREAVNKWRAGGFHLVLMDIQLPVMSGLEATREIRRLERTNSIGAFSTSNHTGDVSDAGEDKQPQESNGETAEEDKLQNRELFKSPVIIVALTASSLQSDRHEALAAGCNDFLTKPVTYVWLERKVMEWGCMQALIDYDGWRKWKSYGTKPESEDGAAAGKKAKSKKNRGPAPNSSSSDGQ